MTENAPPDRFGRNVKLARERNGLSRTELARRIGVDKSEITRWEQGVRPHPKNLKKLHEALTVSSFELPEKEFDSVHGYSTPAPHPHIEPLPVYTEAFRATIRDLAQNAKVVQYTSLCKKITHSGRHRPIELTDDEFLARLSRGEVLFQRIQVFFQRDDLLNALVDAHRLSRQNYHCRYFPTHSDAPPAINMSSYDNKIFVVGGYYESRAPNVDERALKFDDRAPLADFFREYWRVLWAKSREFPGPADWRTDDQLPQSFGKSQSEWENLVSSAERIIEKQ
jgi:transcriptional regulator with XRE-family HTH domain